MGLNEVFVCPNKDKVFKYKAYDKYGNLATGISRRQAINNYYIKYKHLNMEIPLYDMEKIKKDIDKSLI